MRFALSLALALVAFLFISLLSLSVYTRKYQTKTPTYTHLMNVNENMKDRSQFDSELIAYIRSKLIAPSDKRLNLSKPGRTYFSQYSQSQYVDKVLLLGRRNGFYLECGAYDGETDSNSLFFERERNWTGLLIEPDPITFTHLLSKNRHAYALNACISPYNTSRLLPFTVGGTLGGLNDFMDAKFLDRLVKHAGGIYKILIECFPLYSVLAAVGVNHIDYLSLDVESVEIEILKTVPFDKISISAMSVEMYQMNHALQNKRIAEVRKFMEGQIGYNYQRFDGLDIYFTHPQM